MKLFHAGSAVVAALAAVALVTGCGGDSDNPGRQGGSSSSGGSSGGNSGSSTDYYSLDCGELQFLASKYSSIADSALNAPGDSPAATMSQLQGAQAANLASKLYGIMGEKGCSVDS